MTHDESRTGTATLLLIHGGLWEDGMNADRFWTAPGIAPGLQRSGFTVLTPNRPRRPASWEAEVEHLAAALPDRPVALVAGSNGCSVAIGLALAFPHRIERLLLAWPATANDPVVDARTRSELTGLGASTGIVRALLGGQTLRGVADTELATLAMPVGVLPSVPENPVHQRLTVDALRRLVRHCDELPGCPEPPRPDFGPYLEQFLISITEFAGR